ncbi:MAG: hypothetical protein ABFD92_18185 [Planctomycetaceae bacterium]|nr:hypothetical protein [Planctomycetaceae bacterium]
MNGVQKPERDALRPAAKVRVAPALALCVIILLAGVTMGVGISAIFPSVPNLFTSQPAGRWSDPAYLTERYMKRIDETVGLSKDQEARVRPVIQDHVQEMLKIRRQLQPELIAQTRQLDRQIRPLLRDDQIPLWETYYNERMQRWNRPVETQPATQAAPAE